MVKFSGGNVVLSKLLELKDVKMTVPGSKSISNRVMILSALNCGRLVLKNVLYADDTLVMMDALRGLGIDVDVREYSRSLDIPEISDFISFIEDVKGVKDSLEVRIGYGLHGEDLGNRVIFTGNSGTTMRFLCSFVPLLKGKFVLDGSDRMRERPIGDLTQALAKLGVDIEDRVGYPPVKVNGRGEVEGGKVKISGKLSSQYISSVMMSGVYYRNGVEIEVDGNLVSKPFVDLTIELMKFFGLGVRNEGYRKILVPNSKYCRDSDFYVEPDLTNAFYFLCLPAVVPGKVSIFGIGNSTIQGDIKFLEILKEMGCSVEIGDRHICVEGDGNPRGLEVDMNDIPDLVQTLGVISLFADRPTVIRNVYNLRIKETDRINALARELRKVGADVEEYEDGLKIIPRKNYRYGVEIDTYDDHRMAMSFAIAGVRLGESIVIRDYKCTSKTFPSFWDYLDYVYKV